MRGRRRWGTSVSQLSSPQTNRFAPGRRRGGGGGCGYGGGQGREAIKIKGREGEGFRVFERRGGGFHGPTIYLWTGLNHFTKGPI
jgi:hypothetical protein